MLGMVWCNIIRTRRPASYHYHTHTLHLLMLIIPVYIFLEMRRLFFPLLPVLIRICASLYLG